MRSTVGREPERLQAFFVPAATARMTVRQFREVRMLNELAATMAPMPAHSGPPSP